MTNKANGKFYTPVALMRSIKRKDGYETNASMNTGVTEGEEADSSNNPFNGLYDNLETHGYVSEASDSTDKSSIIQEDSNSSNR